MFLHNPLALSKSASHLSRTEQEFFVDIHQLLAPELIPVEYVRGKKLRGDTAGQIL